MVNRLKFKYLLLTALSFLLLAAGCQREKPPVIPEGEPVDVSFQVGVAGETKAMGDGSRALRLTVRVYDASGTFLQDTSADRAANESGWTITTSLVPGTYSFSFWASSPDSQAYSFNGRNVEVNLSNLTMNSDVDDAFWAVVSNKVVAEAFIEDVTLSRPLAQVCLYSKDDTIDLSEADLNDSNKFTSSFVINGTVPTRMNLLDGSMDDAKQWSIGVNASLKMLEKDGTYGTALAFIYLPSSAEGLTLSTVEYRATLKRTTPAKELASGTVSDVRIQRNKRTLLLSAPQPAPVLEAVDLGLPSGLKWASFNLGATAPEEIGTYYAWKDVATETYYGSWRMPTKDEIAELIDNCTYTWTTVNGVNGGCFTATNGNSIFLPAAGFEDGSTTEEAGEQGYYWSSSEVAGTENKQAFGMTISILIADIVPVSKAYPFQVRLVTK